ncbi:hypothetical protein [Pontibacter saemangeumensis]
MRNAIYVLLALLLVLISCEKEDPEPVKTTYEIPLNKSIVKDVTPNSVVFQYKVSAVEVSETGIYIAKDSSALAPAAVSGALNVAEYNTKHDAYSVSVDGLEPYTNYWYTVKIKDVQGKVSYTKAAGFETAGFNLAWREGFSGSIESKGTSYETLYLTAEYADTELNRYAVSFGGAILNLVAVEKKEGSDKFTFVIQVPKEVPPGAGSLSVYYGSRKIFEDGLRIEQGNVFDAIKVSQYEHPYNNLAYYKYNGKVHIINLNNRYRQHAWSPSTKQWEETSVPTPEELIEGMEGHEIDGKIYFGGISKRGFYVGQTYIGCQERIYAYDPVKEEWEFYPFYSSSNSNEFLRPNGSFVYQNKLYCIGRQLRVVDGAAQEKVLLQVFNPADKSWEVVMELQSATWGYKGIAIQGRIYVVAAEEKDQYAATVTFRHRLYELDLASRKLIKKADLVIDGEERGSLGPNLFEYRGHLFVYGGKSSIGYYGAGTTGMYEYAPEADSWTEIFPTNADIPSQNSFCYVIDDRIYLGLGLNPSTYKSRGIYEIKIK